MIIEALAAQGPNAISPDDLAATVWTSSLGEPNDFSTFHQLILPTYAVNSECHGLVADDVRLSPAEGIYSVHLKGGTRDLRRPGRVTRRLNHRDPPSGNAAVSKWNATKRSARWKTILERRDDWRRAVTGIKGHLRGWGRTRCPISLPGVARLGKSPVSLLLGLDTSKGQARITRSRPPLRWLDRCSAVGVILHRAGPRRATWGGSLRSSLR